MIHLLELLEAEGPARVDVSGAESWDLACLQLLYAAGRTAGERGRRLALEGCGEAFTMACRAIGAEPGGWFEGGC